MIIEIQAQIASLFSDLFEIELGHVIGDPEWQPPFDMGFGVNDVDLFKFTTGRLDIKEEAKEETDKVKECEEEIDTPRALATEQRREHDHGKVADPVGAC